MEHTCGKGCWAIFGTHYEGTIIALTPIIVSPVMLMSDDEANNCMYVLLIMIVFWITEYIPLGITSALPIILFPPLGIMPTDKTCRLYFRDTLFMFITSLMVASAIEYSKLHIRLALKVLQLLGCSPRRLHLGICFVTMFLSMWIANAAATAMMLPIICAVLEQLASQGIIRQFHENDMDLPKAERRPSKLATCFYLSVCFSSSVGGIGSLIGTPTNLAFKGIYEGRFENATESLDFAKFSTLTIPTMLVATFVLYIDMEIVFMGLFRPNSQEYKDCNIGKEGEAIGNKVIDEKYAELGDLNTHEVSVGLLFVTLICLYVMRSPGFVTGWADLFDNKGIKNSVPTVAILVLLFCLPSNYKFLKFGDDQSLESTPALLNWEFVIPNVPWGLIFLVGGGAVLAEGSKVSGMATKLGNALTVLDVLPGTVVLYIVILAASLMTNFSANTAICNILLPVCAEMAVAMERHPLYFILPVGLGCSMAFLLPVGTPPNAMVQGYSNLPGRDMFIGGVLPTFTSVTIIWISAQTYNNIIYPNIGEFPEWAILETNDTTD